VGTKKTGKGRRKIGRKKRRMRAKILSDENASAWLLKAISAFVFKKPATRADTTLPPHEPSKRATFSLDTRHRKRRPAYAAGSDFLCLPSRAAALTANDG